MLLCVHPMLLWGCHKSAAVRHSWEEELSQCTNMCRHPHTTTETGRQVHFSGLNWLGLHPECLVHMLLWKVKAGCGPHGRQKGHPNVCMALNVYNAQVM